MDFLKTIPFEYFIYSSIAILLVGIILGFTKTITVYRDFADLTKVFMLVLAPIGLFILLGNKIESEILKNIFIGIEGLLILWILAFITKIPLGIIFALYLINLVSPGGSTNLKRRQNRGIAAIIMLFLGPILYGLVRNKTWSAKKHQDE